MQEQTHDMYWVVAGVLILFGFLGSFSIGLPFLIVGLLMSACGFLKFGVGDYWAAKGSVRWVALPVGAVVAILATLALTATRYQLANEPFGAASAGSDGPTAVGMVVGFITGSIATFLAFLAGVYVVGKVLGSRGPLAEALVAVFGVLLEGVMSAGPLLGMQQGAVPMAIASVLLALLGGSLGGWLGGRSGPRTIQPSG